jgi:hypothetical protein
MRLKKTIALLGLLELYGCGSGIGISRPPAEADSMTGVPWNLSMTQFTVTLTREITGCTGVLKGKVSASIVAGKAPDPDQRYLLDSTGWWATSDITSSLSADGTSTGLNATSQDATAQVIASVVGIMVSAVEGGLALGDKVQGANQNLADEQNKKSPSFDCSPAVHAALQDMRPKGEDSLQKQITHATQVLSEATEKVTLLTAQYTKDPSYKKPLAKAMGDQSDAQDKLNALQARLTRNQKVLVRNGHLADPSRSVQRREGLHVAAGNAEQVDRSQRTDRTGEA